MGGFLFFTGYKMQVAGFWFYVRKDLLPVAGAEKVSLIIITNLPL
jgi:hypothetical protein